MSNDNNIHVHRGRHYVAVPGQIFKDGSISLKAKGLYATIYSLPEEWKLSVSGLVSIMKEGKSAIYAALTELKVKGYVQLKELRDERGRMKPYEYHIFDEAIEVNPPLTDFPQADKPEAGNPYPENPPQYNNLNNTNSKKYNSSSSLAREGFVKKGVFPRLNDIWVEDLRMFIKRMQGVTLTVEQVNKHYIDFEYQENAKMTDTDEMTESEWRQHFANYIRKRVSVEKKERMSAGVEAPVLKGSYLSGVEATDKRLEAERNRKTMTTEEYLAMKNKNK